MTFKFLPHTADIKIEVNEKTLEKAFVTSALALKEVISDKTKIKTRIKKRISVRGEDRESLLCDFLGEFLYLVDAKDFILSKISSIKIKKDKKGLKLDAMVIGDKASNYKFTNEVKAITYNEMLIKRPRNKTTIVFVIDV